LPPECLRQTIARYHSLFATDGRPLVSGEAQALLHFDSNALAFSHDAPAHHHGLHNPLAHDEPLRAHLCLIVWPLGLVLSGLAARIPLPFHTLLRLFLLHLVPIRSFSRTSSTHRRRHTLPRSFLDSPGRSLNTATALASSGRASRRVARQPCIVVERLVLRTAACSTSLLDTCADQQPLADRRRR
jgi:hypothetical protein